MSHPRLLSTLLAALFVLGAGAPALAQAGDAPESFRMHRLKNALAEDLADTIRIMMQGEGAGLQIIADDRTNSLLVRGMPDAQAEVTRLVERLDVPVDASEPNDGLMLRVFTLKHVVASDHLVDTLSGLYSTATSVSNRRSQHVTTLRIAADPMSNQIIARGIPAAVESLQGLIAAIDQPRGTVGAAAQQRVRLLWLIGGLHEGEGRPLPPDVSDVAKELSRLGITNLRLAGQSIVRCTAGEEFQSTFVATLDTPWNVVLEGQTERNPDGSHVLNVSIRGMAAAGDPSTAIETKVTTPNGHFVVLGVGPVGKYESVFVIQISDA